MFPQRFNAWDIQGTIRKHFIGKVFLKVLDGKFVFVLKLYDLITTNVDLFTSLSNHKVMFPEYLRNISRMSALKIFQEHPWNIVKLWDYF